MATGLIDFPAARMEAAFAGRSSNRVPVLQEETELDIVRAARDGDHHAFDRLYQRYYPRIHGRVLSSVPYRDAEDVTQEIFLAAVRSLPNFDARSSFSTWLTSIATHKIVDYYRRRPKLETVSLDWPASGDQDQNGAPSHPEPAMEEAVDHDDRLFVRAILARLPRRYRQVLLLRLSDDLGFAQIAERLALTEEAARSLFRRAVAACQQAMTAAGEDRLPGSLRAPRAA